MIGLDLILVRVVEIDFVFVCGPKGTCLYGMDQSLIGFSVWIKVDLVLVFGS